MSACGGGAVAVVVVVGGSERGRRRRRWPVRMLFCGWSAGRVQGGGERRGGGRFRRSNVRPKAGEIVERNVPSSDGWSTGGSDAKADMVFGCGGRPARGASRGVLGGRASPVLRQPIFGPLQSSVKTRSRRIGPHRLCAGEPYQSAKPKSDARSWPTSHRPHGRGHRRRRADRRRPARATFRAAVGSLAPAMMLLRAPRRVRTRRAHGAWHAWCAQARPQARPGQTKPILAHRLDLPTPPGSFVSLRCSVLLSQQTQPNPRRSPVRHRRRRQRHLYYHNHRCRTGRSTACPASQVFGKLLSADEWKKLSWAFGPGALGERVGGAPRHQPPRWASPLTTDELRLMSGD